MAEVRSSVVENFSITAGGPLHRLLTRLDHIGNERQQVVRRALIAALITWLPLLLLSIIQGSAWGHRSKSRSFETSL